MKVPHEIRSSRLRAAFVAAFAVCTACLIKPPTSPPVAVVDDRFPEKLLGVDLDDVARPADHCRDNWALGLLGDEARIHAALAGWKP